MKVTVWLKNGATVSFQVKNMAEAIQRIETEYYTRAKRVDFEQTDEQEGGGS